MTDTLTAALEYAKKGWRVLPIKPGMKRPAMTAWQDAATTDTATIQLWWTQLYAGHGVGIATGNGVFVLDVDVSGGKAGDETLRELEDAYGPLPDTVRTITGSGGAHIYFRHPPSTEIRNDAGRKLGAGLDIRGTGGQVVAPPTIHPITGMAYAWEDGCGPDEMPIAEAPGWLLAMLTAEPEQVTPTVAPIDRTGDDGPAARYNDSTTWAELLSADGWTLGHTDRDGCQHWTRPGKDTREGTSATVGYQGRDILRVFTSSIPDLPEGAYSKFGYTAATRHHGNRSAFATELLRNEGPLPPLKPLTPWSPEAMPNSNSTTRLELAHLVDWQRFWDNDQSDENWLAYPIVPAGRAIALYAPAKAGKSTITLAIAAAVATGRPVLGKRVHPITEVLYLDYEMTPADLQQRLLELGYGPDDDLEHLHYALLPSLPPLDTVEGATAVLELIDTTGAEFVVVDTFGRAVGGEEDHADTVRAFYRHTGLSLKARGVTYLRTDHAGKDVAKGMRGSSAKNDDVDLVWQLSRTDTKDGHGVQLKRTHSRVSWVPEEVKVKRIETDDGFDYLVDGDVKVRPDGTRQIMEQMIALGITATTGQRPAAEILKAAGIKVKVREMREALGMLKETTANGLSVVPSLTPWTPQTPRQDSVAVETAQARQDSVAVGSNPVALVAVKGHMGSQLVALDAPSVALDDEYRDTNASPLGLALSHQPTGTDEWLF